MAGEITKERLGFKPSTLIVAVVVVVAGGFLWWWLKQPVHYAQGPPITPEAKAYVRNLRLAEVEMKAAESFMRQAVVEITGKIGNAGERPLKQVDLNCVFYDPYGQLVLRERVSIVKPRSGPLNPGQTRSFRLAFDNIPQSWNQALPQLVIAGIQFD
ncbi:MAG: FxLYD domain-containing protein [Bryobacterales bacterium]|nr:FxLYD domain-containing protein [Bryobacterales bacterium]